MSVRLCCPCAVVQANRLSLARAATSIIYHFCCNKRLVTPKMCLSRQTLFCRDRHLFVMTKDVFCRNRSMLVTTNVLLPQKYACHDKCFVVTKHVFCDDKSLLSRQKFCHGNHTFVVTNFCHNKNNTCGSSHQ